MAPFYSTLSIWIGGIVLVAMLKVTVSEESIKKMGLKMSEFMKFILDAGSYF